jgi:hypothetical protein
MAGFSGLRRTAIGWGKDYGRGTYEGASEGGELREPYLLILIVRKGFGGPDRDRTDDLFHAMEARSQLRHRPTC